MTHILVSQLGSLKAIKRVVLVPNVISSDSSRTVSKGYTVSINCENSNHLLVTQKNEVRVFKSIDAAYSLLINYVCDNNAVFEVNYLK